MTSAASSPVMNCEIRPMRMADYEAVHALWSACEGIGLSESDSPESIGRFLARNPDLSLVAVADGRIVGAVLCGHDGRRGYLHHLAVAAHCRGKGIGRRLVGRCLARLHPIGIAKCNIFLFSHNNSGEQFWRRLDWQVRSDLKIVQRATAPEAARVG